MVLVEVRRLRVDLLSVGAEIMHHQLTDFRLQHGIKLGRDNFTKLLRDNNVLIRQRKRRARTTWSEYPFRKYANLTKEIKVDAPNQLHEYLCISEMLVLIQFRRCVQFTHAQPGSNPLNPTYLITNHFVC